MLFIYACKVIFPRKHVRGTGSFIVSVVERTRVQVHFEWMQQCCCVTSLTSMQMIRKLVDRYIVLSMTRSLMFRADDRRW